MYHRRVSAARAARWIGKLVIGLASLSLVAAGPSRPLLYLDYTQTPADRARDLIARMTLDQKVRQMQNNAPAIPELQVPAYNWWNEALHGVARAGRATVFPQAIGLAATWDTDLLFRVADVISTEARAKYHDALQRDSHAQYYGLTFWSPNINIFRDPRWGRGQETYGEDPYLTGRLAVAFVMGMQGSDATYFKTIATAKHFAVHSGPESTRHAADVAPSAEDLARTYLPAFRAAIVEGHADSVMCAYNSVNGVPACANADLLQRTLKQDWGFDGYIVSDCGAIRDIYNATAHHFLPSAGEASAAAVKAGTDLTCGTEYTSLAAAVGAGFIREADIDAALVRLFTARFKLGMFDPPERVPYSRIPMTEVESAPHRALALDAARASIVLLKNDRQTLPLRSSVKSIAVIGPAADDPVALLGNYNGFSARVVTAFQGIDAAFAGKAAVAFAPGAAYAAGRPELVPSAVLTPPSGGGHGLLAEYFTSDEFAGTPKLSRVEPAALVQNARDPVVLAAGPPQTGFAIRFSGTLTAPATGDYAFSNPTGFGSPASVVRLFLDDVAVVSPPPPPIPPGTAGPRPPDPPAVVSLQRGRPYRIRVEYRPSMGRGGAAITSMQLQWLPPVRPLLDQARDVVSQSDVTIAVVGLNPSLEGEEMSVNVPGFKGGDRTDLALPAPQQALLDAAIATGKPVIVVLASGSAVALGAAAERAHAVLAAWYGGEEIGTAIADTLSGRNNPAGRLPITFYRSVDQLPPFEDYAMRGRTYRYFTGDPLYRFGFGLSYSTFRYSNVRTQSVSGTLQVTARVTNTSARDGDEVVQLYVGGSTRPADPVRELKGFTRVHLRAGESRDVAFTVQPDKYWMAPFTVSVGGGQPVAGTAYVSAKLTK